CPRHSRVFCTYAGWNPSLFRRYLSAIAPQSLSNRQNRAVIVKNRYRIAIKPDFPTGFLSLSSHWKKTSWTPREKPSHRPSNVNEPRSVPPALNSERLPEHASTGRCAV